MLTTTIGAYPKPTSAPISDWFSSGTTDYTSAYLDEMAQVSEEQLDAAVREVVTDQVDAGIDIPTDGEVRRENYIHYQCRMFGGFDFDKLRSRRMRGTTESLLPSIREPIAPGQSVLPRDYRVAQAATDRPLKITIPGPMTIIDSTVDEHYHDDVALGADLAEAVNHHVLALVDAGCTQIQVDEPVMARKPDVALAHGIEQLSRCFDGVPEAVTRTVHACCGYPNWLDQEDYPKADPAAYLAVARALDAAPIDALSIEDAHCHNDLATLLPQFERTTIIFGAVGIARSRVETVEEIHGRLKEALRYLPAERLIAAPDCGLGYLGRELTLTKLRNLSEAAHSLP